MIFFSTNESQAAVYTEKFPWLQTCLQQAAILDFTAGGGSVAEGVDVKTVQYETSSPSVCEFETHRDHVDVQVCIEGEELIRLARRSTLKVSSEWDSKGDVLFYEKPEMTGDSICLVKGSVAVLFPEDAHCCGESVNGSDSLLRKFVFKVKRETFSI
ncbi:MAG: YhcH/YjgK/YiaL family protein [Verrucomicrobiales bacterium]|nr:YhcH/YjgK/YiaL family protein [Verrucomicrobiales bacterium]